MNKRFIEFSLSVILFLIMSVLGSSVHAGTESTVEEIIANKDSYDGKEVLVSGTVSSPKFKAARRGKAYMTFPVLGHSGGRINILFWGDMKLKPGKKVRVTGFFKKIMEVGKYSFRDVIEASKIIQMK